MLTAAAFIVTTGCRAPQRRVILEPLPLHEAVQLVNANVAGISGTLRASGPVDGHFTHPDHGRRSYHLDGVLFYLAPANGPHGGPFVRFDLKALGERQFLFGSNAEFYWAFTRDDRTYHCRPHGQEDPLSEEIPIRPDRIVDALGLSSIPPPYTDDEAAPYVHRVIAEYQQILFLERDADGRLLIQREYWLDRSPPRLVRYVIFRDREGRVMMESRLDDYRPLAGAGSLLPHRMTAVWPRAGSLMRFRVSRWTLETAIGPDGIQFATPRECLAQAASVQATCAPQMLTPLCRITSRRD